MDFIADNMHAPVDSGHIRLKLRGAMSNGVDAAEVRCIQASDRAAYAAGGFVNDLAVTLDKFAHGLR